MKIQVTLYDKSGKYRPVSALVPVANAEYVKEHKDDIKNRGIRAIMIKRGWTRRELIEYNYLTCKMRVYPEAR